MGNSGDHWQRLQELFDGASPLSPKERPAYFDRCCGDDAGLREELESLLRADDGDSAFLRDPVCGAAAAMVDAPLLQNRIGAYLVTGELGRGGMGAVYRAVRADDAFRKEVAIKVIRGGADDEQARRRFRAERQILATLDHPHIARLLDGGATKDGRPYVVMELLAQPGLGEAHVEANGGERNAEEPRDLRVVEPAEEMQLHHPALARVVSGEPVERFVHRDEVFAAPRGRGQGFVERERPRATPALGADAGAGVVHEDAAHLGRGHGEEVRAVLPGHAGIGEAEERFVNEGRRLQGMTRALAAHVPAGQAP